MELKKKLTAKLFDWIVKEERTSDSDIKTIIEYVKAYQEEYKDIITEEDIYWINQTIVCLQARNFKMLPIDFEENSKRIMKRLLYKRGLSNDVINTIIDLYEGRIKPNIDYERKVKFVSEKEGDYK